MYLLDVNFEGWGVFVSIVAVAIGILTWWIGKLLDDKKNITIVESDIKHLKETIDDMKDEIDEMRRWYNTGNSRG